MSQTVDIRELNELIASKSSFVNMITMGMDQVKNILWILF